IITGSNAKLLAREMATALTGRYTAAEVLPFSFSEYLIAKGVPVKTDLPENRGRLLAALEKYMNEGGFPETALVPVDGASYLSTLFDAVIFKDVAARHRIRVPKEIYDLALFLASNPACEFSYREMAKQSGMKSTATLIKYVSYLEESYIFDFLNRFSFAVKKQSKSPKKAFLSDNGFMAAKGLAATKNTGRLFENMVYGHLRRQGYEKNKSLFYYRSNSGDEIDFVLKKGNAVEKLVQACCDISSSKTLEREIKPLALKADELRCDNLWVFTRDSEGSETYKGKKIHIAPVWKEMTGHKGKG
ncbi:MAG TPA: ATP-binding protein, partial [Firmicutes bacterium]|nr:ATP-binding protein [Bacillota bacterium]